jgi:Uncharacterized NAD(FAD)-dependent dehydrogenases
MKVVIVGGVACGAKTAARLARICPEAEITMLERGQDLSYSNCGFPFLYRRRGCKCLSTNPYGIWCREGCGLL